MKNRNKGPRNQDLVEKHPNCAGETCHKTTHERHKEHEKIINRETPKKKNGRIRPTRTEPVK